MWGLALSLLKGKGLPWVLTGVLSIGAISFYYFVIKPKIEKAAVTELLAEQRAQELDSIKAKLEKVGEARSNLEKKYKEIELENDRFLSIFREHDFTELSYAKPGLIERRVNEATDELYSELEEITSETRNKD